MNEKRSTAGGTGRRLVRNLFETESYYEQLLKIAEYVEYALSKHGPAIWGDPLGVGITEETPGMTVSPLL